MVSAACVALRLRAVLVPLKVLLEFLLAAGLLRLAHDPTWTSIAVAAVVVAVRRLLSYAFAQSLATTRDARAAGG